MDHQETIKNLPSTPGVYIMKGEKGEILYVGKADNLKRRVSSYFQTGRRLQDRIEAMVSKVKEITYIPASSSAEALIYENGLIKQLSPRYNVSLRDDKSYPLLKLTANEKFPRLFITRQKKDDGALYFGPYTSAKLLRQALGILKQIFPLRTCKKMPKSLCLNFHIKQCLGPCEGKITEAGYSDIMTELKLFLDGRREELLKLLSRKMEEAAKTEDYEIAAQIRDRVKALAAIRENKVSYSPLDELEELKNILGLNTRPDIIEAFDVSNIMGKEAVGSLVYFYKGRPKKSEYKRFRIKTVSGIDDYGMMREIVRRRYTRLLEEEMRLPDLVLIDGGKGHLNAALEELKIIGLERIPAIGIAKAFEHIFTRDRKDPIILPKESKVLHLLERVRDEAHRFAINYHKSLLSKNVEVSELDKIPGIGAKRKKALLKYFGSIEKIRAANLEDILKVEGMSEKSARNIIGYFKE